MKLIEDSEFQGFQLSSGRVVCAWGHVIGISPRLGPCHGYDDDLWDANFSAEERKELADYVCDLWQRWAKKGE